MIDDAELVLKQNSSIRFTKYKLNPGFEPGSKSIIDLIKGGVKAITGTMGANPLSVYRLHTGVVTIDVKGTEYITMLCNANDCKKSVGRSDINAQLHVAVLDGLIALQDDDGNGD